MGPWLTFVGAIHDIIAQIAVNLLLGGEVRILRIEWPIGVVEGEVVMIVPPGIANGLQTWLQQTRLLDLHLHDELRVHVDLAAMGSKDDSFIYLLYYYIT